MENRQTFTSNSLQIHVEETEDSVTLTWQGVSVDREPAAFITPILVEAVKKCSEPDRKIILDFRELTYMNSSTITPVIKVLERAKRGMTSIQILYNKTMKWQDLIFSALEIFATRDGRVLITGL